MLEAVHHDKLSTIGFKLKRSGTNNVTDAVGFRSEKLQELTSHLICY